MRRHRAAVFSVVPVFDEVLDDEQAPVDLLDAELGLELVALMDVSL